MEKSLFLFVLIGPENKNVNLAICFPLRSKRQILEKQKLLEQTKLGMLDSCHSSLHTTLLGKSAGVRPGEDPVLFQFDQSLSDI